MLKTRFFQIVFSLSVIAALCLAMAPAPVYALSASRTPAAMTGGAAAQISAATAQTNILICRVVIVRHNGHILKFRRCIHIDRPS
jgi:hypothetical protein